jgi:transposase-like protein
VKPKIKRGRGTKKIPVVGIKERSTTHVYAKVMLPDSEGRKLTGKQPLTIIEKACKEGTVVATDGFGAYKILDKKRQSRKYSPVTVNHSKGQYYTGNGIHINGIENFWSILKRGIIGVYHHVSGKYLHRYVDEFCFRQNTRLNKNMFNVLLCQCVLV